MQGQLYPLLSRLSQHAGQLQVQLSAPPGAGSRWTNLCRGASGVLDKCQRPQCGRCVWDTCGVGLVCAAGEGTLRFSFVLVREAGSEEEEEEQRALRWEVAELRGRLERLEQVSSWERHGCQCSRGLASILRYHFPL